MSCTSAIPLGSFSSSTSTPFNGGDAMKIINLGRDGKTGLIRYKIDQPVWKNGKGTHIHRVAFGSEDLARKINEVKSLSGCSLTKSTLSAGIDSVLAENDGAGMKAVYEKLKRDLGRHAIDDKFQARFWDYVDRLKKNGLSKNTISNYKSCVQHTLRRMEARGYIQTVPIKDFQIERTFRSRMWTEDERKRIYQTMRDINSHLYWSVYFAERNPIRCRSDLWTLRREALVLVGPHAPYVRFQPAKTASRHPGPTTLPGIDAALVGYWDELFATLPDCDLLFPRVIYRRGKAVRWESMGNPHRHWAYICSTEKANVLDFHFHDLRHVAITNMLRSGWTRDQLKKLGIQYTDRAISVYDHTTADDVLEVGPSAAKTEARAAKSA